MSNEKIRVDVGDGIMTATLHRPEKLNAIDIGLARELLDAIAVAARDDSGWAVGAEIGLVQFQRALEAESESQMAIQSWIQS